MIMKITGIVLLITYLIVGGTLFLESVKTVGIKTTLLSSIAGILLGILFGFVLIQIF